MNRSTRRALVLTPGVLLLAGCMELSVPNTNNPDRELAIQNPGDVETLVLGSWSTYWGRVHNSASTYNAMPTVADEHTVTYANNAALELSSEPRPTFNNNSQAASHEIARFQWYDWYSVLSNANEALAVINDGLEVIIGEEDRTEQTVAFAKLMQGLSLGYIGLLFDQGFIADEETAAEDLGNLELVPYTEVLAAAIENLEEAAQIAQGKSWVIDGVINGTPVSAELLGQLAHTYAARLLVYSARTPEDRAAVDWNQVLFHLDRGITEDHTVTLQSGSLTSSYLFRYSNTGTFSGRGDHKLIGPADVSGTYAAWLARDWSDGEKTKFLITTPDRRITGETPESDGKYYRYQASDIFRAERGLYHFSSYQFWRWGLQGGYNNRVHSLIPMSEMDLLRAEALYFQGDRAAAADLANRTRTANGELPPLTAEGVPASADCVPRMDGVNCASLLEAIYYERMIEGVGTDALRAYIDSRGIGRLSPGTFVHFPIPARELETLGLPVYTWGGVGQPGAAQ